MQTKRILVGAALLLATLCMAQVSTVAPSSNDYPQWGFHIQPFGPSNDTSGVALSMYQPADNGFATNVNVVVQTYSGNISEYSALSKLQLLQSGMNMIGDTNPGPNEWTCEYTGVASGKSLHFYQHVTLNGKKVYLATGTALADKWTQFGAEIKKCCDSLQINAATPGTGASPKNATTSSPSAR